MKSRKPAMLALTMLVWIFATGAGAQSQSGPLLLEGAFNEPQAIRGQALYYQHCLDCHGEAMGGVDKAPPLAGPQFNGNWLDAPLSAMVARILTMPPEKPGALSQAESVDVLTYILWYNGLPLGSSELDADMGVLTKTTYQTP